jgi:hypothetical protein
MLQRLPPLLLAAATRCSSGCGCCAAQGGARWLLLPAAASPAQPSPAQPKPSLPAAHLLQQLGWCASTLHPALQTNSRRFSLSRTHAHCGSLSQPCECLKPARFRQRPTCGREPGRQPDVLGGAAGLLSPPAQPCRAPTCTRARRPAAQLTAAKSQAQRPQRPQQQRTSTPSAPSSSSSSSPAGRTRRWACPRPACRGAAASPRARAASTP